MNCYFNFKCICYIYTDGKCQEFSCASGKCLGNYTVCNGYCDCEGDCRDEKICDCTGLFLCDDGQCLVTATEDSAFCNGVKQCADGEKIMTHSPLV